MVLSKGIVDRHDGKMWLHSNGVGHGATFAFGLPLSKNVAPTNVNNAVLHDMASSHYSRKADDDAVRTTTRVKDGDKSRSMSLSVDPCSLKEPSSPHTGTGIRRSSKPASQEDNLDLSITMSQPTAGDGGSTTHHISFRQIGNVGVGDVNQGNRMITNGGSESLQQNSLVSLGPGALLSRTSAMSLPPLQVGGHPRYAAAGLGEGIVGASTTGVPILSSIHAVLQDKQPDPQHGKGEKRLDATQPLPFASNISMAMSVRATVTSTISTAKERVLIAEDDPVCRKMLTRVMKGLNYDVVEAEDGIEALSSMKASLEGGEGSQRFDLVLSDWVMPNMDGPSSVAKMRESGYNGPIFGVTGNQLPADIEHFTSMGANRVLAKPLKIPALKQAIEEYGAILAAGDASTKQSIAPHLTANVAAKGAFVGDNQSVTPVSSTVEDRVLTGNMAAAKIKLTIDKEPAAAVMSTTKGCVLIAEDDPVSRNLLSRVMKGLNYDVVEAGDGVEALNFMKASLEGGEGSQRFDLVLSDWVMPNMDGPSSVAKMRESGYNGPIFGVTGNQLPADIEHFTSMGANRVLAKPLKIPALKQAIEEHRASAAGGGTSSR